MIFGAVLAGGASRRMGRDKALVEVVGAPMIRRVATALRPAVDLLIVAGRADQIEGLPGVPDPVPGQSGPLAGVAAATDWSFREGGPESMVVAVAVDHPFVRTATLRELLALSGDEAVIPVDSDMRQVTCGVYPAGWRIESRNELEAGGSLQSLLDRIPHRPVMPDEWTGWGEDGRSWFSVDDEAALADGLARFGSGFE